MGGDIFGDVFGAKEVGEFYLNRGGATTAAVRIGKAESREREIIYAFSAMYCSF